MFTRAKSSFRFALFLVALNAVAIAQSAKELADPIMSALRDNDSSRALQLLQPALHSYPNNPQLWMLQGLAYSQSGDKKSALVSYRNALKIAPEYLAALEGAAQLEYEMGSSDAVPHLEHVLRLRPSDS